MGAQNVEVGVARFAVEIVIRCGWKDVIFEGDCSMVILDVSHNKRYEAELLQFYPGYSSYVYELTIFWFFNSIVVRRMELHMSSLGLRLGIVFGLSLMMLEWDDVFGGFFVSELLCCFLFL